jgi:hypothetical protein
MKFDLPISNSVLQQNRILSAITTILAAYSICLSVFSQVGLPQAMSSSNLMPYLSDKPIGEDGFYMLTVAWNLAGAKGIVYNYAVPTTGIQPLSTFIYAGLAWIIEEFGGSKWIFLSSVLILGVADLLLFAHLAGKISQNIVSREFRDQAYFFAFVLSAFSFWLYRAFTYGLETGFYLTLIALCVLYTLKTSQLKSFKLNPIVFGILAGLTALARIDFGIVLFVFVSCLIFRREQSIGWISITGAVASIVVMPWLIWVYSVSGTVMPSSGRAEESLITLQTAPERARAMGQALLEHLTPWGYEVGRELLTLSAFILLCGLLIWLLVKRELILAALAWHVRALTIALYWLVATVPLFLVYVVFFGSAHFYARYTAPFLVVLIPLMAAVIAIIMKKSRPYQTISVAGFLLFAFFAAAYFSLHTGNIGNTHAVSAGFINREFPQYEKIGAFQSGVIGFFNPNIVNLDGKVNSEAIKFSRDGKLNQYLDDQHIDVLVDWPDYIYGRLDKAYLESNWVPCAHQVPNGASICLTRKLVGTSLRDKQ